MKVRRPFALRRHCLSVIATALMGLGAAASPSVAQTSADDATLKLGQRVFLLCQACHSVEEGGMNKIGPNLFGVFGRAAGGKSDFAYYSDALKKSGITWSDTTLDQWLTNPSAMVPGTKMSFRGIDNPDNRKAVIAYLKQQTSAAKK